LVSESESGLFNSALEQRREGSSGAIGPGPRTRNNKYSESESGITSNMSYDMASDNERNEERKYVPISMIETD